MPFSVDLKDSLNSTAKGEVSGRSGSGEISGGSAFNIQGINLGTNNSGPANAAGGNPNQSLAQSAFGDSTPLIIVGAAALLALLLILRRR